MASTPPVGIGIIGTGTIAQAHLTSLQSSTRGRAVAVYDVLADRAEETAERFGIPYTASSLDDLLARPEIDGVIVCTPPFAHAEPTIKALEAGKHVLCEKPFALDPAEAEPMVQTAERTGTFLACASARDRYGMAQTKAHEMVENGELGDVYHVRSSFFQRHGFIGDEVYAPVEARVFPYEFGGATGGGGDVTKPFVENIAEGRQPMTPGRDALVVTRVINAAYTSASEHRSVSLD